jgi:hypothetical protein
MIVRPAGKNVNADFYAGREKEWPDYVFSKVFPNGRKYTGTRNQRMIT